MQISSETQVQMYNYLLNNKVAGNNVVDSNSQDFISNSIKILAKKLRVQLRKQVLILHILPLDLFTGKIKRAVKIFIVHQFYLFQYQLKMNHLLSLIISK